MTMEIKTTIEIKDIYYRRRNNQLNKKWVSVDDIVLFFDGYRINPNQYIKSLLEILGEFPNTKKQSKEN